MDTGRRTAIIFVNFHSEAQILPRARRLADGGITVVVADNSGTFPAMSGVTVVPTGANLGFAAGCNAGAAHAPDDADTLCFHNPDVDISLSSLARVVDALGSQARPGLAGAAEVVGGVVRRNGYHYPGPLREAMVIAQWVRNPGKRSSRSATPVNAPVLKSTGRRFASAALLVADAAAFHAVGGFDARFFMYGEDLDLWHRVAASGRDCGFAEDALAEHAYGRGSPLSAARRELYRWIGVELFVALNGVGSWRLYRAVHRAWLPMMARRCPELAAAVGQLWSGHADPATVAEALSPALRGLGPEAMDE